MVQSLQSNCEKLENMKNLIPNWEESSPKGQIIVVDDTPANLHLLVQFLRSHGYQVRAATDGYMALRAVRTQLPDLILLDILMPEIDGYEVCRQLKADALTSDIPVIFISALNEAWDKVQAFTVGGADYISKPFHSEEVLARVQHHLNLVFAKKQLELQNQQLQHFSRNLKQLHRLHTTPYPNSEALFLDYLQTGREILGLASGMLGAIADQIYTILAVDSPLSSLQPNQQFCLEETYCQVVTHTQKTIDSVEISHHPIWAKMIQKSSLRLQSYISTPIWVEGKLYGTLCFFSEEQREPHHFDDRERELIELMAESLGKLIAATLSQQKRQQAEEQTQLLLAVTQAISVAPDFESALKAALAKVCEAGGWTYGEVWIPKSVLPSHPRQDYCVLECSPAWHCEVSKLDNEKLQKIDQFRQFSRKLKFALNEGLPGRVWQTGKPEYSEIYQSNSRTCYRLELAKDCEFRAALGVPIGVTSESMKANEFPHHQILAVMVFFLVDSPLVKLAVPKERSIELVTAVAMQLGTVMQRKQAETELRSLLQTMDDWVMVWNRYGRCVKVAPTKAQALPWLKTFVGKTIEELMSVSSASLLRDRIIQTLDTQQGHSVEFSMTFNLSTADHETQHLVWLDARLLPLNTDTVICVCRDISDRKVIEQMKDEFISVASHELRTPLTSIRGSLGLLATGRLGELSAQGQRMLEVAINNTERLHRLVNDILDLERIESGKVEMAIQACNAIELILQGAEALQAMADEAQIALKLTYGNQAITSDTPAIAVQADPDQILQALTNLINNAIKFSSSQTIIEIGVDCQDTVALFFVQDQGRGIPPNQLETIFERFRQVDASDSRQKGGTGLGLPICREIIKKHGGKLWVESELGRGSRFCFTLPLA